MPRYDETQTNTQTLTQTNTQTADTKEPSVPSAKQIDRLLLLATISGERVAQSRFYGALRKRLYVLVVQEIRRARFFLTAADVDDLVGAPVARSGERAGACSRTTRR